MTARPGGIPAAAPASRPADVFDTMGTTASLRGPAVPPELMRGLIALFVAADHRFSTYRPDSELSRINRGGIGLTRASRPMKEMYERALEWRMRTGGRFTPHTPDGLLDLNGVVKAHTMAAGESLLLAASHRNWCLSVGGDLVADGMQPDGRPWTIGVVDPSDPDGYLTSIRAAPGARAVATSGTRERGHHLWDGARADSRTSGFLQATVVASDIITADVLATTLAAGGPPVIVDLLSEHAVQFVAVSPNGRLYASAGFRQPAETGLGGAFRAPPGGPPVRG
ncbi:FAD:protein FMN transferase [Arthrobacter pityocampae]|uniref:FAD:protein FMN transferase n=1 Tax=Arthrobacter pityocampae TaxID=547334 RepID=UPI0037354CCD